MARNVTRLQPGSRTTLQPTNGAPRKPSPLMSHTAGIWAQTWPMLQYNPSELLTKKGPEIFDTMLLADQIRAAVAFKTESVLATGWVVESPEDQPEDWPVTEFVRRRLNGITNSFERCLRNILTATVYGYSITEQVYKEIEDGVDAGLVGIHRLVTHSPHYLRFKLDENGSVLAIKNDQDGEEYRRDKFMVWSYNSPFRNPYGQSDLEACYRAYILEHNTYRWLGTYLERMGIPPWIAFYNPESLDPGQQEDLKSIVKNMQNATSATLPRGAKDDLEIWVPQTSGNVQAVFMPAIQLLKQDMARALLMPGHLGISPDATQGSLAKARVALDMFLLSLSAIQSALGEVIQHELVNRLVDFNFDTKGVYPRFHFLEISTDDAQAICKTWGELVDLDVVNPELEDEQHIRSMLKFPRRETEDKELPESGIDPASSRIPFRYLKDVAGALTKNEVRAAMGYPPLPQGGDELLSKPVAPPPSPQGEEAQGDEDTGDEPEPEADDAESPEPKTAEEALAGMLAQDPFPRDETPPEPDAPGLTKPEQRCDFAQIVAGLDGLEEKLAQDLAATFRNAAYGQIAAWRARPPTVTSAPKAKLPLPANANRIALSGLTKAYRLGRSDTKQELKAAPKQFAAAAAPTYEPEEALKYLESKAGFWVKGMNDKMTEVVRQELMFGLRNGHPFTETANRMRDALSPWIGAADADPKALRPDRMLTTVRTNATDAYNQGRVIEARRSAQVGLVTGMQHSSVLDSRTSAVCRAQHGKCYRIDDPALDTMTPPLHHRCRSILLPITFDVDVSNDANDPLHWTTPEEIAEAKRLVPGEFGGSFTATKANAPKPAPLPPTPPPPAPPPVRLPVDLERGRTPWESASRPISTIEEAWHGKSWAPDLETRDVELTKVIRGTKPLSAVAANPRTNPNDHPAFYQPADHSIEMRVKPGEASRGQTETFRHEFGHAIDCGAARELFPGGLPSGDRWFVSTSAGYDIGNDAKSLLADKAKSAASIGTPKAIMNAKRPGFDATIEEKVAAETKIALRQAKRAGFAPEGVKALAHELDDPLEIRRLSSALYRFAEGDRVSGFETLRLLAGRVEQGRAYDFGAMDDAVGAITLNELGRGHTLEYYTNSQKIFDVHYYQPLEAFANYVALRGGDAVARTLLDVMRKMAPTTTETFDRYVTQFVEKMEAVPTS